MSIAFEDTRAIIANHMLADGMSPIIDLKKSHGSWLVDGHSGKKYLVNQGAHDNYQSLCSI